MSALCILASASVFIAAMSSSNPAGPPLGGSGHSGATVNSGNDQPAYVQVSFVSGNSPLQAAQLCILQRHSSLAAIYAVTKPDGAAGLNSVAYSGTPTEGTASWVNLGSGTDPAGLALNVLFGLGDVKRLRFDCEAVPASSSSGDGAPERSWNPAAGGGLGEYHVDERLQCRGRSRNISLTEIIHVHPLRSHPRAAAVRCSPNNQYCTPLLLPPTPAPASTILLATSSRPGTVPSAGPARASYGPTSSNPPVRAGRPIANPCRHKRRYGFDAMKSNIETRRRRPIELPTREAPTPSFFFCARSDFPD